MLNITCHFSVRLLLHTEAINSCCGFDHLDSKVILALRRAEHLKKLIYVSCNPRAAMNNFVEWVFLAFSWLTKCGKKKTFFEEGGPLLDFYLQATFLEAYLSPETAGSCGSWHGMALPNTQVIMEILGVVNNPVMELSLGKKSLSEKSSSDEQCTEIWIHFFLPFFPFPIQPVPGPFQQGERSLVPARESHGCGSVPPDQALWVTHLLWEAGIHQRQPCSSSSCQQGHSSSVWLPGGGWHQPSHWGGEPGSCCRWGLQSKGGLTLTPERLCRNCFCFLTVLVTSLL